MQEELFILGADGSNVDEVLAGIDDTLTGLGERITAVAAQAPELDSVSEAFAGMGESAGGLDGLLSGLTETFAAIAQQAQAAAESLGQLSTTAETASGQLDAMAGSADAAAGSLDTVATSATAAATAQEAAGGSTAALGEQFTALRTPLLLISVALAAIGLGATVLQGQYESSMSVVQALTGQTAATMAGFNAQILAMAPDLGAMPKAMADGLYYILSAGTPAKDAMSELKVVTEASAAAMVDAAKDADALTTVLNAYAESSDQAMHTQDLLLVAVRDGKSTMDALASSIGKAASMGSVAHVGFNQVAAAWSTLTLTGVQARMASMDLYNLMLVLDLKTDGLAKRAKGLGISFDESAFKTMDLYHQLQYLETATGGNASKLQALIGNAPAFQAATKLMTGGGKDFAHILDDMRTSSGMTAQAFAVHEQTMGAKWDHLKATVAVAGIQLGHALEPMVTSILTNVLPAVKRFSDWAEQHGPQIAQIVQVVAGVLGGVLVAALGAATVAFVAANLAAVGIVAAVGLLAGGAVLLSQHWGQITAFFQSSTTPALAVKAALIGLGAAVLIFAVTQVPALITAAIAAVPALLGMAAAAWAALAPILVAAAPFILIGAAIALVAFGIFELIKHWAQVQAFFAGLAATIGQAIGGILAWFGQLKDKAVALVQAAFGFIKKVINDDLNFVKGIVTGVMHAIVGAFAWMYQHNYYFQALVDAIKADFHLAQVIITTVWNAIKGFVVAAFAFIKQVAENDWAAIQRFIIQPVQRAVQYIQEGIGWVRNWLTAQWAAITARVDAAWQQFTGIIANAVGLVKTDVNTIIAAITGPVDALGATLFSAGQNLVTMLINGITSMAAAAGNAAKNIAANIASFLGFHSPTKEGPGRDADQWMPNLGALLEAGLNDQAARVQAASLRLAAAMSGPLAGGGGGGTHGGAFGGAPAMPAPGAGYADVGAGLGGGGGASTMVLVQMLAELRALRQGAQAGGGATLGGRPVPASLGGVTQQFGGITVNGVSNIYDLYAQLTQLAGLAQEYGRRGSVVGLGV